LGSREEKEEEEEEEEEQSMIPDFSVISFLALLEIFPDMGWGTPHW
jgi:hypothetical protein